VRTGQDGPVTQFSLFGAAAVEPTRADLDGVLLAGGQWLRSPAGARLSIVVADRWRADALAAAFGARGVGEGEAVVVAQGGFAARTARSPLLDPDAARWVRGASQGLPAGFELGSGGLLLWAIAAGQPDLGGYLLGTAEPDGPVHRAAGAQLARLGVAAVSLGQRGGPGWRVTSARRLRRLAELLGPAPDGGAAAWPVPSPH
jgi:hypothetical protein